MGDPLDPTLNVKESLAAAVKRLDDIRAVDIEHGKQMREQDRFKDVIIDKLREQLATAEASRIDALASAEARRLDALRSEDRGALTAAALAVEAKANAIGVVFDGAVTRINDRIIALEQAWSRQDGARVQSGEGAAATRWTIERIIVVIGIAVGAIEFLIRRQP